VVDDSPLTFHISVWRPWLLAVAMLAVPVLIAAGVSAAGGQPAVSVGALVGLTIAAGGLLLPIGWAVSTSHWDVDASGIGGPDNWHVYRSVRWSEIRSVSRFPVPGYPFVWVNTAGRRWAFWVPLFLTDMPGFRAAVSSYAPPHNPLRQYLEKHFA